MPARELPSDEDFVDSEQERNMLLTRIVALEREVMKARRTEKVLYEMEQRYLNLMDSAVFLYMILSPSGILRMINRRAEEFFGFQLRGGTEMTLQSLSGPGYTSEAEFVLKEAAQKATRVTLPVVRADGTLGWLNMELSSSRWQGTPVIQSVASDVTELIREKTEPPVPSDYGPAYAIQMLASCPGLLCFAVDREGVLLYATRGYREIARRFLGHECAGGLAYPAGLETAFDMELHELIREAYNGSTGVTALTENGASRGSRWNVTVAPLFSPQGGIVGAVANLTSLLSEKSDSEEKSANGTTFVGAKNEIRNAETPNSDSKNGEPAGDPERGGGARLDSQLELLNALSKMCVILDENGCCLEANAYFLRTLRLRREDVVGSQFSDFAMEGDSLNEGLDAKIRQMTGGDFSTGVECRVCTRNGEVLCLELKGTSVTWGDQDATLVSCTDNTRLRRTEEQLKRMSTTDSSTGTLNRQGMERVLETEVERALRYRGSLSIVMFDIDRFRNMNERIGYAASDRILRELATIFRSRIRSTDFLGRWGGDEFMILTPCPINAAIQLAEQLRDMTEHQIFSENTHLTLSGGIAELRKDMDVSAFVACAYDAMTEAKRGGGNRSASARELLPAESLTSDE
jgi:diguanylate cyclase (GGDEF)-like protein/PAS domain S-box-containing protein